MTQSILIGNPLELTRKGILELHKLKNKETYIYLIDEYSPPFTIHSSSQVRLIDEAQYNNLKDELLGFGQPGSGEWRGIIILPFFIQPRSGEKAYQDFLNEADQKRKLENKEIHESLYFEDHWRYPSEEDRTDVDLLYLHHTNPKECFVEGTRKIVIPKDVKWTIQTTYPFDREYIQEKARTWG